MIQPVSAVNVNKINNQSNKQSFGLLGFGSDSGRRPSLIGGITRDFATGACIAVLIDGAGNAIKATRGLPQAGIRDMTKNAGVWGGAMVAIGLVFSSFDRIFGPRR